MEYREALEFIYSRQKFGIKLGLQNIKAILEGLEEPHKSYPAVLIAGTNGKGSTAAMIASILHQEGYRVGLYTSPHLIELEERIQVNNKCIPATKLTKITEQLRNLIAHLVRNNKIQYQPTFFEVITAIGLEYFKQEAVDVALLEVGMGGRLDATNSINPLLSVITNISIDHCQHLGCSLKDIAIEKTGIIRKSGQVVISRSPEEAINIVIRQCKEKKASFIHSYEGVSAIHRDGDFRYQFNQITPEEHYRGLQVGLRGIHQVENAATAVRTVELLKQYGFGVTQDAIVEGLKHVCWPGRLELVSSSPQIWLDGAHNVAAVRCVRDFILNDLEREIILIFSALKDKDIDGMSRILFPLAKLVILPKLRSERAIEPEKIAAYAPVNSPYILIAENTEKALKIARKKANSKNTIVVTGSLYLVGEVRGYFQSLFNHCRGVKN